MSSAYLIDKEDMKELVIDKIEKVTIDIMEVYQVELEQSKMFGEIPEQMKRLQDSIKLLIEIKETISEISTIGYC